MKRSIAIISFSFFLCASFSQSLFEDAEFEASSNEPATVKADFGGYGRASAFGGGKTYPIANSFAEIALQTKLRAREALLNADVRLREGVFWGEETHAIDFKELYVGYMSESLDLLIGNQIVNWGRTDGFNPTNNLTPNDYFFLTSDPDDQKMSNFMLRLKYRFSSSVDVDLIGIPFFKPSIYKFDLFDLNQAMSLENDWITLPTVNINVDFSELALPEKKSRNGSFGTRLNFQLPQIDFSLSYFSGYDPYYGFDLDSFTLNLLDTQNPVHISYSPKVYKKRTVGADFALPLKACVFRGELAYNFTRNKDSLMYIPNRDLRYVFALEKMWNGYVFLGQYIGSLVVDYSSLKEPVLDSWDLAQLPVYAQNMVEYQSRSFNRLIFNQHAENNHAVALSVSKSFAYDALNVECTGYYSFSTQEYLLRPKLSWRANDYLTMAFGANYMHAEKASLFSFSSKLMNGVFLDMRVSF